MAMFGQTTLNDIFQPRKGPAADKQNMTGIYGGHRHHGIFAGSSHRNFHIGALQKFQKCLLHRLTADITLVGIFFFCQFINLIDVYNSPLCPFYIIIRIGKKFGDDTFHIITDIAGFRKGCGIGYRQWYLQNASKGLHQKRFSTAGGTNHEHVGFFNLNIATNLVYITGFFGFFHLFHGSNALIMIVDTYGNHLFGMVLSHDIFIQISLNHMRCR